MNFKTIMTAGIDMDITNIEIIRKDFHLKPMNLEWNESANAWSYYDEQFFTVETLGELEVVAIKKATCGGVLKIVLQE